MNFNARPEMIRDGNNTANYAQRTHVLRQLLADVPAGPTLDIACGSGALIASLGISADGVDIVDTGAFARNQKGVLYIGDVCDTALWRELPQDYAQVFALDILEHVVDANPLIAGIRSVLRPGGTLILSLPNDGHLLNRTKFLLRGRYIEEDNPYDQAHVRSFTPQTARAAIGCLGLTIQDTRYLNHWRWHNDRWQFFFSLIPARAWLAQHFPALFATNIYMRCSFDR